MWLMGLDVIFLTITQNTNLTHTHSLTPLLG